MKTKLYRHSYFFCRKLVLSSAAWAYRFFQHSQSDGYSASQSISRLLFVMAPVKRIKLDRLMPRIHLAHCCADWQWPMKRGKHRWTRGSCNLISALLICITNNTPSFHRSYYHRHCQRWTWIMEKNSLNSSPQGMRPLMVPLQPSWGVDWRTYRQELSHISVSSCSRWSRQITSGRSVCGRYATTSSLPQLNGVERF